MTHEGNYAGGNSWMTTAAWVEPFGKFIHKRKDESLIIADLKGLFQEYSGEPA